MSTARKLPDPNAKKRVKFISSKIQPVYRPRRSRCDTVKTTDRETGGRKVEFSEDLMAPAPRKETVHFTKIAVGEVRPPRSRTRVKHDAPMLSHPPQPQVTSPMKKIPDCQKQAQTNWKPRQPRTLKLGGETIPKRIRPRTPVTAEVPKDRSRIQREQPTKSSSTPVYVQNETSSRDAAIATRNNNPACISPRKNYARNSSSSAPGARPTRERPVTSSAAPPNRREKVLTPDLNPLNALNAPLLRFFEGKVRLPQKDINRNSEVVNSVLSTILEKISKEDEIFSLKQLNTGSYYEKLKVSSPKEFDVMLVLEAHLIRRFFSVHEYCRDYPGFAKLVFNDCVPEGRARWGRFLSRDGKFLSPEKLVRRFYELIQNVVTRSPQPRRISNVKQHGPAVTLTIDGNIDLDLVLSVEVLEWPSCAKGWGSSNRAWPATSDVEQIKMKEPKFYLVAKPCPDKKGTRTDSHLYWRISFSEAEKTLLKSASSDKKYYRITKAIFQAKKPSLYPLTSFHLKNLFLHHRCEHPRAKHDDLNLGESVVCFFQCLIDRLEGGSLRHFFVNRLSLLSDMSEAERMEVARKLRQFLKELVQNPNAFLEKLHFY